MRMLAGPAIEHCPPPPSLVRAPVHEKRVKKMGGMGGGGSLFPGPLLPREKPLP